MVSGSSGTMSGSGGSMRRARGNSRPQTPQDFELLKSLRYEDAVGGVPPVPVSSITPPSRPATATTLSQSSVSPKRARITPTSHAAVLSPEVKRDSGIAPPVSNTQRASYAESHRSSPAGAVAREPLALPTIVVQDVQTPVLDGQQRSPLGSPSRGVTAQAQSAPTSPQPRSSPTSPTSRVRSFHGIEADIPRRGVGGIDLEDLRSDKVAFTQRGSLLFGGKKMNDLIATQGDGTSGSDGIVHPMEVPEPLSPTVLETVETPRQDEHELPIPGLVVGKRLPSVQLLQTTLQEGRVLSAEEIGFSMKVRTMYEHGDERAADWLQPVRSNEEGEDSPESMSRAASTLDVSMSGVTGTAGSRRSASGQPASRPLSTQDVRIRYSREAHEFAGGIEDWEDVNGQDVDRYGFISPGRKTSRPATSQGTRESANGGATTLRPEASLSRKERSLYRGLSSARSSRSLPPRTRRDDRLRKTASSMHSTKSGESRKSVNLFQFKDRRTLAEAGGMLTLPSGLTDVVEQQDASRAASTLRRREWARDEKWQKMAHPIHEGPGTKGGGMRFRFDISHPKLVSRTWKGIPDRWRAAAWYSFLANSAKGRGAHVSDEKLVAHFHALQDISSGDDVQIDVDVPRTINMHIMFRRRYRGGQRLLFRLLHAISLYCPEPGYVQGMASLAATLLCYYDEDRAFVMMVRLWQLRGLEQLFQCEFVGLIAALNEFEREWLQGGDVAQKLEELGIPSTSYGTRWYLTLFNLSIPFPAQLRVWDVFMLLGDARPGEGAAFGGADLDVLHATSASLMDATRGVIVDADFEVAMKVLTGFVQIKDEDLLMRVARTEWKMRKRRLGL